MIRINIFESDQALSSYKIFWHNFIVDVMANSHDHNYELLSVAKDILREEYNAKIIHDSLEFDNQEDATAFILKWS